ncbi:hypothetical protein Q7P37_005386 [Cladosporium fusiforme]
MASLDEASALRLVATFFEREWAKTDVSMVHISEVKGGLNNTLQLIRHKNPVIHEPEAILIRHYGSSDKIEEPPESSLTLSATQQAVVHWEMSRRGWGPEVYGFFPGGRLEEYIDSHTLTASEQPAHRRDIARSYARLHSLRFPLRKDGFEVVIRDFCEGVQNKYLRVVSELAAIDDPRAEEYASIFQSTDWVRELQWVSELLKSHACKVTVIHGDANYQNVLIKKHKSECQVVLVDYETLSYNYRGFDIGGHFSERMYCYDQPESQLTGREAPDVQEQRRFCEDYLQELRRLRVEGSENDTVDQLMLESRIGRLYQILSTNLMCTVYDEIEVEPLFLGGLAHMMRTYKQLKLELIEELGIEG